MDNEGSTPPTETSDLWKQAAEESPTVNQLVAYNMTRARRLRDWTQQEVAERLAKYTGRPWSKASISAAERSWQGGRPRKFDANELVALAVIFEMPVSYFLLPPDDGSAPAVYMAQPEDRDPKQAQLLGIPGLLKRVLIDHGKTRQDGDFFHRAPMAVRHYMHDEWHPPVFLSPEMVDALGRIPTEPLSQAKDDRPIGTSQDVELVSPEDLAKTVSEQVRRAVMDQSAGIAMSIINSLGKQGMLVIKPTGEVKSLSEPEQE